MSRLPLLVRREFTEAVRQRWLLVTLSTVLLVIGLVSLFLVHTIDRLAAHPVRVDELQHWMGVMGVEVERPDTQLLTGVVAFFEALVFNQLMSFTAVMAGHAGIHDRQVGTLPFLLLAPIRRIELLVGKVVGSLTVPMLVYVCVGLPTLLIFMTYESAMREAGAYLPPSSGWFVSFFLAAPAWSVFTGTLCVIVSSLARDVRTAQQGSWAVVFFATIVLSPLLVGLIPAGALAQAICAAVGMGLSAIALVGGTWFIGRDLTR